MVFWDDLGFATNYAVDAEVEYPGDGDWAYSQRRIAKPGSDLVGGPQAIIRPGRGEPWLLVTAFVGLGALYATADPSLLCVFEQFDRVVLVNTEDPSIQVAVDDVQPVRVAASVDQGLLLVCEWSGIVAVAANGVRWRAQALRVDDLKVTRADGDRIYYRGVDPADASEVRGSLDAVTGELIPPS